MEIKKNNASGFDSTIEPAYVSSMKYDTVKDSIEIKPVAAGTNSVIDAGYISKMEDKKEVISIGVKQQPVHNLVTYWDQDNIIGLKAEAPEGVTLTYQWYIVNYDYKTSELYEPQPLEGATSNILPLNLYTILDDYNVDFYFDDEYYTGKTLDFLFCVISDEDGVLDSIRSNSVNIDLKWIDGKTINIKPDPRYNIIAAPGDEIEFSCDVNYFSKKDEASLKRILPHESWATLDSGSKKYTYTVEDFEDIQLEIQIENPNLFDFFIYTEPDWQIFTNEEDNQIVFAPYYEAVRDYPHIQPHGSDDLVYPHQPISVKMYCSRPIDSSVQFFFSRSDEGDNDQEIKEQDQIYLLDKNYLEDVFSLFNFSSSIALTPLPFYAKDKNNKYDTVENTSSCYIVPTNITIPLNSMVPEPVNPEKGVIEVEEGDVINLSFEYFTSNYGDELEEVWWILGDYETDEIKFLCSTTTPTLDYTVSNNHSVFVIYPIVIMKSGDACGPNLKDNISWCFGIPKKSDEVPGIKSS